MTEEQLKEMESIGTTFGGKCVGVEERDVHRAMTEHELKFAKDCYCELNGHISDLEDEKAATKAQYDAKIKPLQAQADKLLTNIRAKEFQVLEHCFVIHDYKASKVKYVSPATMEIVAVRDMTGDDRQIAIDFERRKIEDDENYIPRNNE